MGRLAGGLALFLCLLFSGCGDDNHADGRGGEGGGGPETPPPGIIFGVHYMTEGDYPLGHPLEASVSPPPAPEKEEEMLGLLNARRAAQGREPLAMNAALRLLAQAHAEHMTINDQAHDGFYNTINPEGDGPDGRLFKTGIPFVATAELINSASSEAEVMFNDLLLWAPDRAIMDWGNWTSVGIGYFEGGHQGCYWVILLVQS